MNGPSEVAEAKAISAASSSNITTSGINHQSFCAHRKPSSSPATPSLFVRPPMRSTVSGSACPGSFTVHKRDGGHLLAARFYNAFDETRHPFHHPLTFQQASFEQTSSRVEGGPVRGDARILMKDEGECEA